jgi:hypothetical protein
MAQTIFGLFVLLAVVSALVATYCSRKCAALSSELTGELRSLRSERSRLAAHDSAIDGLVEDLRSLRGKFYAERRKSSEPAAQSSFDTPPATPADLKAQLRRQVGLVPGR